MLNAQNITTLKINNHIHHTDKLVCHQFISVYDENTDVSDNMNIENLSIFRKIKIKIILIVFHVLL